MTKLFLLWQSMQYNLHIIWAKQLHMFK